VNSLRLAWRMVWRDARGGELRLLALALAIAVAALSAVGFSADRVRLGLEGEARQLLAADLLLVSDHPPSADIFAASQRDGLRSAQTLVFPSMVTRAGGEARSSLADIKAVSAGYPLRGSLRTAPALNAPDAPVVGGPPPGSVWLDERLAVALAAAPGEHIGRAVAARSSSARS